MMAQRSSSFKFNQPSPTSIMQANSGTWENEARAKPLLVFPEHESHGDSLLVPDDDDFHEPPHPHDYYDSLVAPTKPNLFDLEKPPQQDHDHALAYTMINSNTSAAADYKDLVVPHHHDDCHKAPHVAPSQKDNNEAIVPCLSVCSNDPQPDQDHDQDQVQSVGAQSLDASQTRIPSKRKYGRAKTMKKQSVKIKKKMRTLQGLIPNCNDKADKASILDDAIVYVKALQLQLQMMMMPPMHLSYLPTTPPVLGFPPPFAPLLLPHPSSISTHLLQQPQHHHHRH